MCDIYVINWLESTVFFLSLNYHFIQFKFSPNQNKKKNEKYILCEESSVRNWFWKSFVVVWRVQSGGKSFEA